jgi:hypothetical protein
MLVDVTFLAPQQSAEEGAETEELRLYVPSQLVVSQDGAAFVWLADQSAGVARRVSVTLGAKHGPLVEVKEGLNVASRLIVNPPQGLQEGDRIVVTGEDEDLGVHEGRATEADHEDHKSP